jgi:hypothetical protein
MRGGLLPGGAPWSAPPPRFFVAAGGPEAQSLPPASSPTFVSSRWRTHRPPRRRSASFLPLSRMAAESGCTSLRDERRCLPPQQQEGQAPATARRLLLRTLPREPTLRGGGGAPPEREAGESGGVRVGLERRVVGVRREKQEKKN